MNCDLRSGLSVGLEDGFRIHFLDSVPGPAEMPRVPCMLAESRRWD